MPRYDRLMKSYILAIDQGTTGTTVALVDETAHLVAKVTTDFAQIFPRPGWVEHDPEAIWKSVLTGIQKVFERSKVSVHHVVGIGITNQRETVVLWERSNFRPVYNAIVWQCRRTSDRCLKLQKTPWKQKVKKLTGLVLDPYFSGTKIEWLLKNVPGARSKAEKGQVAVGTIDSYLLARLTAGQSHMTDVSNASRTQLMNIQKVDWAPDLLKLYGVPAHILPEIRPSNARFGVTKGVPGLPDGIPICGIAGDQQSALFGQAAFQVGDAKCTFGTGSFILLNSGSKPVWSKSGLLTTIAWQLQGQAKPTYALEGGAFVCGAAVQFLRDQMQFIKSSAEVEALAESVQDAAGVEFVPALTGMGAPYWAPEARGLICGLTRGTTRAHIARATLEAIALQNVEILFAMQKDLGRKLKTLKVDGGAASDNLLMQIQADTLGVQLHRPQMIETTVAGAAFLAGLGCGLWPDQKAIIRSWKVDRTFDAQWSPTQRTERLKRWQMAVRRALV